MSRWRHGAQRGAGLVEPGEESGGDPGLEAGQAFVPGQKRPGGDQDGSEVVGGGGDDGVVDRDQRGWDLLVVGVQQLTGVACLA